jgi:arylsulfatase A-like enzyme
MTMKSRRSFLQSGVAGALALALGSQRSDSAASGRRPNFLVLVTDDQRSDTLGEMGNSLIKTPNLDLLARKGVLFSNNFCTTSICCSSRATLLTGIDAPRHGIDAFNRPLEEEHWKVAFPMLLREAGYRTGFVGKWGLGGKMPEGDYDFWAGFSGQGTYFEEVEGLRVHRTQIIARDASRFLDGCDGETPFCLHVAFKAPHCLDGDPRPFHPDPAFDDYYKDDFIPPPPTADEDYFKALPEFLQTSEGRVRWKIRFSDRDLYQRSVKDYYRLVTGVDYAVGQLVAKLEEKGLAKDTVILFTSDNGFFLGEKGLAGKWTMHEPSIRVPLLVYDPSVSDTLWHRKLEPMTLTTDVAPTLLDYAGLPLPESVQGMSFRPLVENRQVGWRSSWFYSHLLEHPRIPKCEGVRTEDWKYIRYLDSDPLYEELYDLKRDPHEERNLAPSPGAVEKLREMRQRWENLRKSAV